MSVICKICGSDTKPLFQATIMQKYNVRYYKCGSCQFIQPEEPYWLDEAYSSAIASIDVGYASRNNMFAEMLDTILKWSFSGKGRFLDYGGGYGLFVRLMRDRGYRFFRQDKYCDNIFAIGFDVDDLKGEKLEKSFEMVTAFEVFEHLVDPVAELEKMLQYSDSVLFSTEVQPHDNLVKVTDWWYFLPETGQHTALYSRKSLQVLAAKFNCNLYSNGKSLHLITKKKLGFNSVKWAYLLHSVINKLLGRNFHRKGNLIDADWKALQQKLMMFVWGCLSSWDALVILGLTQLVQ